MKRVVDWHDVPVVLNTEETQELLGIEARTLRKMARDKEIPAKKINHEWRFLKDELYKWIHEK